MADNFTFDYSELDQLAANLGTVASNAGKFVNAAVVRTSVNIKKDWVEPLKGSRTLPLLPYAVNFDITTFQGFGASVIKSEIGFDKTRKQGSLGNVSEFGTPTITGRGFGITALEKNQDDFERGLSAALEDAERVLFNNSSVGRIIGNYLKGSDG